MGSTKLGGILSPRCRGRFGTWVSQPNASASKLFGWRGFIKNVRGGGGKKSKTWIQRSNFRRFLAFWALLLKNQVSWLLTHAWRHKPQPEKVLAILAVSPPKNVKKLRSFLEVVQYYLDIWRRRSHLVSPLSDLVAECDKSKTKKRNQRNGTILDCWTSAGFWGN